MSANEYARARGRGAQDSPSPQRSPLKGEGAKPLPLTSADQARIASNRALVREHMPDALPFIKDLHEMGLISGWRDVVEVEVFPKSESGGRP